MESTARVHVWHPYGTTGNRALPKGFRFRASSGYDKHVNLSVGVPENLKIQNQQQNKPLMDKWNESETTF
ncbi:hypothetical protein EVAR_18411_1 [Eumeta japonica]|uniref:Uncharacterized protein n=1 Tax=Eumeta variegata TaxID=151549 RepID=A0A4C1UTY6_EUMVA|nr:hypothetical protein EVAR_18411_1 [Eumeta japonica]